MSEPQEISYEVVSHAVIDLHVRKEDLFEGDLLDRIAQYETFERRTLKLSDLNLTEFFVDEDLVAEYAKRIQDGEMPPPIVFDPVNRSIIDGIHRANAVLASGLSEIDAFVGTESTYQAILDEDEELDDDGLAP